VPGDPEDPFRATREAVQADRSVPVPLEARIAFFRILHGLTPRVFVTHALLVANVGVFVAMVASGVSFTSPTSDSLIAWGADYGPYTSHGEWWRLASSMFLHIGVIHIACNMIGLWGIGGLVERLLGNAGFLIVYLLAGIAGSLASNLWNPYVVSAGASGAIFGIYGALLGFMVREQGTIPREIFARLRSSGVAFLGYNLVFGLSIKGINMAAHFGGLVGGFLCGLALSQPLVAAAVASRPRRNLAVAAVGAAAVAAAVFLLPPSVDLDALMRRFDALETAKIGTYNAAIARIRSGAADDEELARVIETEILPEWTAMRRSLEEPSGLPEKVAAMVGRVDEYALARENAWRLTAEAIRGHDDAKERQAREANEKVQALIEKMNKGDEP